MAAPARPRPLPYPRPKEPAAVEPEATASAGTDRRRFLSYLIAAPTLVVAARLGAQAIHPEPAGAAVPSLPEPSDLFDLGDLQNLAASPTSGLISVVVNTDGTASFAMPRAEVGQGITTAIAMLIAEEIDLPLEKVDVTLADARPELVWNQLTGGSNTIRSLYTPVRIAAAGARSRLISTAAKQWKVPPSTLTAKDGVITSKSGKTVTYGAIAAAAAASKSSTVSVNLKPTKDFTVIGKSTNRVDALAAVTGAKVYTMDLVVPNALPTMVCRPPTINGTVKSVANLAAVKAMPGITDVAIVSTGVAVRGNTFGQCIDAVDALVVTWGPGTEDHQSDETVLAELKKAEIPLAVPPLNLLAKSIESEFTFYFRSNSPLETNCAIADVRKDSAEIWSSMKSPVVAQETIAQDLKLPVKAVTCHVMQGGGSFGRHLFFDAAREAAEISQKMGKPVKLMWHRTDDFRHGRTHPMATSRIRVNYSGKNVLTYEQRHTSVSTDFTHGFGEILTEFAAELPLGNLTFAETIFELTQNVPYNFGVTTQLLNEVDLGFHTGSMRNIYSPDVCTATELMVDQLAAAMKVDPYVFRKQFLKDARSKAVLDKAAQVGGWGKTMPAGTAQGIALHNEYKGCSAALVEIDCRPETVNRPIENGVTGPRVTKVVYVVDVGLPINPKGLEAQMLGGIMDGIAQVLTSSLHFKNGIPLEGSWDNYYYTRQWNVPLDVQVVIMPPTTGKPGGAGEFGVASSMAAIACAYARATGTMPTSFPINHNEPLGFTPLPLEPPLPEEPTNGLG
ncbi:molybdopterin cofactor-binding domain-containing protein [Jatrophihabitans sp.]|uniref:molybdopterin cofactor-binding domain-containing protein n=1 Tax=Jatrophihabitans sp. TaxID=1932789 RepID=UPI0030C77D66|nr:iorB [Jatrophihabitans sp.]